MLWRLEMRGRISRSFHPAAFWYKSKEAIGTYTTKPSATPSKTLYSNEGGVGASIVSELSDLQLLKA